MISGKQSYYDTSLRRYLELMQIPRGYAGDCYEVAWRQV